MKPALIFSLLHCTPLYSNNLSINHFTIYRNLNCIRPLFTEIEVYLRPAFKYHQISENIEQKFPWETQFQKQPPEMFLEISQNAQKNTCARVSFFNKVEGFKASNFIKKETVPQLFSCEFCEISKNTFPYRTAPVAPSVMKLFVLLLSLQNFLSFIFQ